MILRELLSPDKRCNKQNAERELENKTFRFLSCLDFRLHEYNISLTKLLDRGKQENNLTKIEKINDKKVSAL